MSKVKIVTFAPAENGDDIRQALASAGAGQIGEYSFCSYTSIGEGRSMPSVNAKPYIGEAGKLETIQEERIEVVCDRAKAKQAIAAMRTVHPYDEVAFDIYPLIEEEEL